MVWTSLMTLDFSHQGYPKCGFRQETTLANQRGTGQSHQFKGTSIAVLAYWRVPIIFKHTWHIYLPFMNGDFTDLNRQLITLGTLP